MWVKLVPAEEAFPIDETCEAVLFRSNSALSSEKIKRVWVRYVYSETFDDKNQRNLINNPENK